MAGTLRGRKTLCVMPGPLALWMTKPGVSRYVMRHTSTVGFVNSGKAVRTHFVANVDTLLVDLVDVAKVRVVCLSVCGCSTRYGCRGWRWSR